MNNKSSSELISAYHDGELNAAELAAVEQLLATSAAARAELESYQSLSGMFREAGRPTLAADLTPAVMQMIEQRMLLPETAARPERSSRSGRVWTKWAVVIAAVAAGLMVAVQVVPQNPAQLPAVVQHPAPAPAPQVADKPAEDQTAVAQVDPVPAKTPAPEVAPAVTPQLATADLSLEVISDLKRANPGKIVRFMKQSGSDVAVFHLLVRDVQPGLEALQKILSAQQIAAPNDQVAQPGTVAVYVQASQDELDKVIAELQSEAQPQFVALAVQPAVKADEFSKLIPNQPAEQTSRQVALQADQLYAVGVAQVPSDALLANRSVTGSAAAIPRAMTQGNAGSIKRLSSSFKKLLIVVEKAPQGMLPTVNKGN